MQYKYLIGIDEAGRGPLAGPVAVGIACVGPDFNWSLIPGVADSKVLTPKKREAIYAQALALQAQKQLFCFVRLQSATTIDSIGIVGAINKAMAGCLAKAKKEMGFIEDACEVRLDGSLHAPVRFRHQQTIIGGDGTEKVIGLASIMAKVTRDRHMMRLAVQKPYLQYDFSSHKGYGTRKHCELIRAHGLTDIHRASFCSRLIV